MQEETLAKLQKSVAQVRATESIKSLKAEQRKLSVVTYQSTRNGGYRFSLRRQKMKISICMRVTNIATKQWQLDFAKKSAGSCAVTAGENGVLRA